MIQQPLVRSAFAIALIVVGSANFSIVDGHDIDPASMSLFNGKKAKDNPDEKPINPLDYD